VATISNSLLEEVRDDRTQAIWWGTIDVPGGLANSSAAASNAYTQRYVAGATTSTANTKVAVANANAAAANANAAAANANVAAANANLTYSMGEIVATIPAGCTTPNLQGTTYYFCFSGNTWFSPSYGANGVYYRVVPTP
jgi:hypothetical protein